MDSSQQHVGAPAPTGATPFPDALAAVIPDGTCQTWRLAFAVSWASLRRRLLRGLITMIGVVLGIAFLTYMLAGEDITAALVRADNDRLNTLLQLSGVDIFSVSRGLDPMMTLLVSLSLLTCLVGIINAMLMAVTERVREIGTLKCLGAMDGFIVKSYFIESAFQGIGGTLIGIVAGLGVALGVMFRTYGHFVARVFPWMPLARTVGLALVIGSLLSVAAAILPAYWAARKEPVDAMRVEQ